MVKTDLHEQLAQWRAIAGICVVMALLACFFACLQSQRKNNAFSSHISLLEAVKQRDIEKHALCEAVADQQYIIRREIPLSVVSWAGVRKENCP